MRRAGCQEVTVNAGKRRQRNPENEPSQSNFKRPKRAEVNFLPNFPQGEDPSSLDRLRQVIVEEVKKTERNLSFINKMMQTTFALRRQTIVMPCPPVKELMDLWPALHMPSEVMWINSFVYFYLYLLSYFVTLCVVSPYFIHHRINNCCYCTVLSSMQVYAEFQRITNQNLPNTFYGELDCHTPRLRSYLDRKLPKLERLQMLWLTFSKSMMHR